MVLNLGNDLDVRALLAKEFTNFLHTSSVADEGGENDVQLGERRKGKSSGTK